MIAIAFQFPHGPRSYHRTESGYVVAGPRQLGLGEVRRFLNPEEAANAELEDDEPEDEAEERTGRIHRARRVLPSAGPRPR